MSVTARAPVRIAVLGAAGRMGTSLVRALAADAAFELVGALVSPGSAALGQDAGSLAGLARPLGVATRAERGEVLARAEVALDFTLAGATLENLAACEASGVALLLGTTGLPPAAHAALAVAAMRIPLLVAANTSLGVAVLAGLIERAARALPADYDIDVQDVHHRDKRDAPSGTALVLGAAAAAGRGRDAALLAADAADGGGEPRRPGAIGFASLRAGDIVGEHTVFFAGPGERLELTHRATDRMTFARGALKAGAWLRGRSPGRYSMADVLGL